MNIINYKTVKDNTGVINNIKIVRFSAEDYCEIKKFVLTEFENINPNYFIIDDIDSELPIILENGKGVAFGAIYNDQIIALQAIDYNLDNKLSLTNHFSLCDLNTNIMEMGWTLINEKFRGNGLSLYLSKIIESEVLREISIGFCIATVHPENYYALNVYFNLGFWGIKLLSHFQSTRLLLVKCYTYNNWIEDEDIFEYVRANNFEDIEKKFYDGYLCNSTKKRDKVQSIVFKKAKIVR